MTKEGGQPGFSDAHFVKVHEYYLPSGRHKGVNKQRKILTGIKDAHKLTVEHFLRGKKLTQLPVISLRSIAKRNVHAWQRSF